MDDETAATRTPLTEAGYAAMLPYRMRRIADVLSERFAAILPDGVRIEYAEGQEGDHPAQEGQE